MLRKDVSNPSTITELDIRGQLDRILEFPELQASNRRRAMLRYIVEEALAGRASELKATSIAIAVFDRSADFDQQSDAVVRLEARKLRRDLDSYYAGAGRYDPVRINIPKGRYVPNFSLQIDAKGDADAVVTENDLGARGAGYNSSPKQSTGWPKLKLAFFVSLLFILAAPAFLLLDKTDGNQFDAQEVRVDAATILIESFETRDNDELVSLLAAGLSHDITAALLKFPDLRVHLRASDANLASPRAQAPQLYPTMQYVVNGFVSREGGELVVRAKLLRAQDSQVLWSERYQARASGQNIKNIKDEISSNVASVVGQQYGIARSELKEYLVSNESNPNLAAYACVARAQIYRRTLRAEYYQKTRVCLEETVREHPEYSRAWAMLAYLRNDAVRFGYQRDLPVDEKLVPAREAAIRALSLNPSDTDALKAMSHIEHYDGNYERSIHYARLAVDANPNDPETIGNLGFMLGMRGRFSEAVPFLNRAIERSVSPAPRYYQMLAVYHMMNGEWRSMLSSAYLAAADGSGVSYSFLTIAHAALGNEDAALDSWKKMAERWPLLAKDPRAAYEVHKLDPAIIDAIVAGLAKATPPTED